MKKHIFNLFIFVMVAFSTLTGCNRMQKEAPAAALTKEQAMDIALAHAGFSAEDVKFLQTELEIDDRIPQYDISFLQNGIEYDYDIDAQTGSILSYDKG